MISTTENDGVTGVNFSQYRVLGNQATFIGPANSDMVTDKLLVKSVPPKRGNGHYGNRKSQMNLVRSTTVTDLQGNSVVRDRQIDVSSSFPVGTTLEDVLEDAYELSILLQNQGFVKALFVDGVIEH